MCKPVPPMRAPAKARNERCHAPLALVICTVLLLATAGEAQKSSPTIAGFSSTTFTRIDGLPQNAITAMESTTDGFIWIGTQAGLARFDGDSFVTFDKLTNTVFADHFVTSLAADDNGGLWIGTRLGLVVRTGDGSWRRYTTQHGLGKNYIRSVAIDSSGHVLAGTYGAGLFALEPGADPAFSRVDASEDAVIRALFQDSQENLWIASSAGLLRVSPGAHDWFGAEHGLVGDFVRTIAEDTAGTLWVGSEQGGLSRFSDGRFLPAAERVGLPENATVWTLLTDHHGHLWVGTEHHGVRRLRDDGFDVITSGSGLPSDLVWSLHEDFEGGIWVGTRAGLTQLKASIITTLTGDNGLTDNRVRTVMQDSRGRIWIGTMSGLDRMMPGERACNRHWLAGTQIRCLSEARDGSVWVGTADGLTRIRSDRAAPPPAAHRLVGVRVNALEDDDLGCLWIGTGDLGLKKLCDGRLSTVSGLESQVVRALHEGADGVMWVGTEAGLARISDAGDNHFHDRRRPAEQLRIRHLSRPSRRALVRHGRGSGPTRSRPLQSLLSPAGPSGGPRVRCPPG